MTTCQIAQKRIVAQMDAEIRFNVQNFDSGPGVEDIVREQLASLLPGRYALDAGVVNDRHGRTADDFDLLVCDPLWSPVIKPGATARSRRCHFPIEGLYAAAEIKQTLGPRELDEAMRKLVTVARLDRPENPYGHITENQHLLQYDLRNCLLNPLHTSVFATRLADGVEFATVAEHFGAINALLDRNHMVTMLCVLDAGTAWYSVCGRQSLQRRLHEGPEPGTDSPGKQWRTGQCALPLVRADGSASHPLGPWPYRRFRRIRRQSTWPNPARVLAPQDRDLIVSMRCSLRSAGAVP